MLTSTPGSPEVVFGRGAVMAATRTPDTGLPSSDRRTPDRLPPRTGGLCSNVRRPHKITVPMRITMVLPKAKAFYFRAPTCYLSCRLQKASEPDGGGDESGSLGPQKA